MYKKEQRWEFRYAITKDGVRTERVCYPQSQEKIEANRATCKRCGYEVLSVKKLYPFNTYANQHNFELIHNICRNRMSDMEIGDVKFDEAEYDRLDELRQKAERLFVLPLPLAWLTWEDWKDAKELSESAILHRQNACVEAGRPDLVAYC